MSKARSGPHRPPARKTKPRPLIVIARGDDIRSFTLRPWLMATAVSAAVLFLTLYVGATLYLVFRDDLVSVSLSRQSDMRNAYEDRITELRADIDKVTSRQLLNQEAFDARMQKLVSRQAALSAREDQLAALRAIAEKAGLVGAAGAPAPVAADGIATPAGTPADKLAAVERSLDSLDGDQKTLLRTVTAGAQDKITQINSVLDGIGQKIEVIPQKAGKGGGEGGPFVPLPADYQPISFRDGIAYATTQLQQLADMRLALRRLPLSRPLGTSEITSGFGARLDPFLGKAAFHPGIDFMAESGTAVHATAPGIVTDAGLAGGYGNMVEIDHGNGVVTRYGHLSRILVHDGQKVDIGTVLGRTGSTGRSTGPHLHYEVRLNGEAIDPLPFIRAGSELRGLL